MLNAKIEKFREYFFINQQEEREKTRLYSASYLRLGFVPGDADKTKPYCLLCCKSLCNDLMRNKKLEDHLKNVHSELAEYKRIFIYKV